MGVANELRSSWRPLSAATLGLAFGYSFNNYVMNIVSPHLLEDFGWGRAQFALLGLTVVIAMVCQPLFGRLADKFGARRIAIIGVTSAPLLYLALSRMNGTFWQFVCIYIAQIALVGGTTSVVVYTRLIAGSFDKARGIALGLASCAPAVAGAAAAPLLSASIDVSGWRVTYVVAAGVVALFGALAVAMIPQVRSGSASRKAEPSIKATPVDYRRLIASAPFRLIIGGMLLCNLTITFQMSQINVLLGDLRVSSSNSALLISVYGVSAIAGRLICGVALDHFAANRVAAIAMAGPAIGLVILGSGASALPALAFALAMLGFALGAEGDVATYLVMRFFDSSIYSSVVGLVIAALSASGVVGTLLLSGTLKLTGSYTSFLLVSAVAALFGAGLFLLLGRHPSRDEALAARTPALSTP